MARIAGVELDSKWRLEYALTKIKGVGWSLSKSVLKSAKVDPHKRVSSVTSAEIAKIASSLEKHPIEGELARSISDNISRLKSIGAYRGLRHTRGLPARGQRTRSNARAKRGKRKTIGAFKKDMLTKMGQQKTKKE